mgnify:CR=1 FL=1
MGKLSHLAPRDVFGYFEELTQIPHGSGDMEKISRFCLDFAEKHGLEAYRDEADNVVIKKPASEGYENAETVILQGHLDMVCQKTEDSDIDFAKDGLDVFTDGDFIHANGTTLGADNGIAVAMIMAILADKTLSHPSIEAVFTTDEEIGMVGALALDMSRLNGKKMINIDSEESGVVTVSCAGGSDFYAVIPLQRKKYTGKSVTLSIKGLKGGHSGVEINSGRMNANILMGRFLRHLSNVCRFDIVSVDGGDKGNAIPVMSKAVLVSDDTDMLLFEAESYAKSLKNELKSLEPDFYCETAVSDVQEFDVIEPHIRKKIINTLALAPNGVIQMSAEIENLVETSLNMGVFKTGSDEINILFALRSNKKSGLEFLEASLGEFFETMDCKTKTGGHYPPWEYKNDSVLRDLFVNLYKEKTGKDASVEAIHAGLECGVFASAIPELDCISVGPDMYGIHTVEEKLSISAVTELYEIICRMLKNLK